MAKTPSATAVDIPERIEDIEISDEMQNSFLEYAYSVIYSRALPDARDGLKPVQRRILYMMSEMGLTPDKGHVKSARVVGEVMGKLHPHGDSAIYDTLVRMAQSFSMRTPLVDGHGNFGSLDDGPAASRYTEARLTAAALAMVDSLSEDVVDFGPNYDNSLQQPLVLPSAFPNLLVNGGGGIAVGMATNMAPHNLREVISGTRFLIANPDASLDEVMAHIPGPDFPSGGIITGLEGMRDAYQTGRGTVRIRAKANIESQGARRKTIVVTELPYQVGPEKVIEKIKQGVQSKKIQGISDLADFTDRKNGLRLVITVKTGFSPEAVLEQLYRQSPLEETFSINNVCLVDGQPQTLGLLELLRVYIAHRISVVRRRSEFRLARHRRRLHLVTGLLLAIADIDRVIAIIRGSEDSTQAKDALQQSFGLSDEQAEYILELRLRRLTKFSKIELEKENADLQAAIAELEKLLQSEQLLRQQVSAELENIASAHGDARRTILLGSSPAVSSTTKGKRAALEIPDTPCLVLLSASGRLLRVDTPAAKEQADLPPAQRTKHDAICSQVATTARGEIGALTSLGRVFRFSPVDLPCAAPNSVQPAAGVNATGYFEALARGERVIALISEGCADPLALATRHGVVKRVATAEWPKSGDFEVIALKPGDTVVHAAYAPDNAELVFITDNAQLLRFGADRVRPQGRSAAGMAGIKLAVGARVISFNVIADDLAAATVATYAVADSGAETIFDDSYAGSVKLSALLDFPAKGRATGGVRAHRLLKHESKLALAWAGSAQIVANAASGAPLALPDAGSARDASGQAASSKITYFGVPPQLS